MRKLCIWLLDRLLPAEWSDQVVGDLIEQQHRSALWFARQTLAALVTLRGRGQRGDTMFSTFLGDMRLGVRHLRRAPAFAATAILTLAVAIGATAAILSVIEPVLLRPLPYPSADHIAFVWERNRDGSRDNVGFRTIQDIGTEAKSIENWAAIGSWEPTLGDDRPERIVGSRVSWTYFTVLGVKPMLGRDFLADEDQPDRNGVVVLSYGLWQRRYAGDSTIIGRRIGVGSAKMVVVGVMPPSFDNVASPEAEIWRVLGYSATQPWACRTCHHLRMLVRVKPRVSMPAATSEIDGILTRLIAANPKEYASLGATVVLMQTELTRQYRPALLALTAAVVLVLLIAIANVANLQLARAVRRETEFAVRSALGAARGRLTRQLLAEGLVLALVGGIAGIGVAMMTLPTLVGQLPAQLPRVSAIHLDGGVVFAVCAIVLVITIIMAMLPGRRGAALGDSLRSGRRLASAAQHRTRSSLVVIEVALAAMLLGSAALVARSVMRLLAVDAGFDPTHLLSLQVDAVGPRYETDASIIAYHDRIREAVRAVPGVISVALSNQLPLAGNIDRNGIVDTDNIPANPELVPNGDRYVVTEEYLRTMRIPIVAGRWFSEQEAADSAGRVTLVSAALAAKLWPGQSALGKHIRMGGDSRPSRTVIGVTGNVKHTGLDAVTTQQFYVPERQWFAADNAIVVVLRTATDPAALAPAVRRAVSAIDPSLPIIRVATMDELIVTTTSQRRLALVLFGAFAVAALLLAAAGIYGVLAGNVAERTREIGLRAALGATPREVMSLVVSQGVTLALIGLVIGLAVGAAAARYLRTFLFEIGPGDPIALTIVVATLALVVLGACVIPARRAVRVDPVEALRND
jgi:putative ABC transport system permease protein